MVYLNFKLEPSFEDDAEIHVKLPEPTRSARSIIYNILALLQRIPVFGLLFSVGIYPWLVLYYFLHMARKRNYLFFIVGLVALLSIAILLICPDNGNKRYMIPLLYTTPYLMGLCLLKGANGRTAAGRSSWSNPGV